jgi:putative mRNA 3-end processing factor
VDGLLQLTPSGLYCNEADLYIDPWRPVQRAVITHAHADHARPGSRSYLCARESRALLAARLGPETNIQALAYGEPLAINSVTLSLHPAGHVLGSAQVRLEMGGRTTVVSGDYKTAPDPTCAPLEPLRCDVFISECTFGLPIFKWPAAKDVFGEIGDWWRSNREQGKTSILFAYALGKAQRILSALDPSIGPIVTHGAIERVNRRYREVGIPLPDTTYVGDIEDKNQFDGALVIAPPSADHPAWLRRFRNRSRAFASGWMRIRGNRRRRSVDRGFVLSDHSDWDGLVGTIEATGAERIGLTHGYSADMSRWLREKGHTAEVIPAEFDAAGEAGGDEP